MPTTVSSGVYHHGKRHRFSATTADDSPEAFQRAMDDLNRQVNEFKAKAERPIEKQSYRKNKR